MTFDTRCYWSDGRYMTFDPRCHWSAVDDPTLTLSLPLSTRCQFVIMEPSNDIWSQGNRISDKQQFITDYKNKYAEQTNFNNMGDNKAY